MEEELRDKVKERYAGAALTVLEVPLALPLRAFVLELRAAGHRSPRRGPGLVAGPPPAAALPSVAYRRLRPGASRAPAAMSEQQRVLLAVVLMMAVLVLSQWWFSRMGVGEPPPAPPDTTAAAPDGPPLLGPTRYPNLFLNTGHGTLGWTMACGSGRIIADLIDGRAPEIALEGLGLNRFG